MFEKYLSVFLISMVPLIELRAAVPIAIGMGIPTMRAIAICAIGNMLPVPIIYLFARKVPGTAHRPFPTHFNGRAEMNNVGRPNN